MRFVSCILVLNLLVCLFCMAQMRKCMDGLGQIVKSEEAIARSAPTLDRTTQLLETHFALSTPRRPLGTNVKTYASDQCQKMCAESAKHKRPQLDRCSPSNCQFPGGAAQHTVQTGIPTQNFRANSRHSKSERFVPEPTWKVSPLTRHQPVSGPPFLSLSTCCGGIAR